MYNCSKINLALFVISITAAVINGQREWYSNPLSEIDGDDLKQFPMIRKTHKEILDTIEYLVPKKSSELKTSETQISQRKRSVPPRTLVPIEEKNNHLEKSDHNRNFFDIPNKLDNDTPECGPLENCKSNKNLFDSEIDDILMSYGSKYEYLRTVNLENRFIIQDEPPKELPEGGKLCESKIRVEYPKTVIPNNGTLYKIINTERHQQGFYMDMCDKPKIACKKIEVASGYEPVCKQMRTNRDVVVMNLETKTPQDIQLPMNSCCKCVLIEHKRM